MGVKNTDKKFVGHAFLNENEDSQKIKELLVLSGSNYKITMVSDLSIHVPAIVTSDKIIRNLSEMEDFIDKNRVTFKNVYRSHG